MSQLLSEKENANQKPSRLLDDPIGAGASKAVSTSSSSTFVPSATREEGKVSALRLSSAKTTTSEKTTTASRFTSAYASSRTSPQVSLVSSSTTTTTSQLVLRPGEALEDLFGIRLAGASVLMNTHPSPGGATAMDEYRTLCESIVRGGAADDAKTWKDVLDRACRACRVVKKGAGGGAAPTSSLEVRHHGGDDELVLRPDFNLLRLHRRATSRALKPPDSPFILDIWLSYASCQLSAGVHSDALLSLQHVQQRLEASPNGGARYGPSYHLRLANLMVSAGNADAAVHALEVGLERHGGGDDDQENGGPPAELVERLAQLRGGRTERARDGTPLERPLYQAKRRTPLSTLSSSSPAESKRLKLDTSTLEQPSESPSVRVDTSLEAPTIKRAPLASILSSKPPSLLTRSTSDDTGDGTVPTESRLSYQHQRRPSLRVPSAQTNVPLLPKLSAYSSVNPSPKPSSPRASTGTGESGVGRLSGIKSSSLLRPIRSDATPTSATVTAEGHGSLLKRFSDSMGSSESTNLSSTSWSDGRFMKRTSNGGSTETTPSRPPLGLRFSSTCSAAALPASASRPPALLDRISHEKPRGVVPNQVDSPSPPLAENERPRKSMEGGKHEEDSTTRSSNGDESKPSPKKVNMDISYMWEWDPSKVVRSTAAETTSNSPNAATKLSKPAKLETINEDETADPPLESKGDTASAGLKRSGNDPDVSFSVSSLDGANDVASKPTSSESDPSAATSTPLSEAETVSWLQKSNRDFLPLVNEANILRVNNIPYLKLGVIGKGGSCKVYRALTKSLSVVAIKKVKLSGMDRKAVSGYANEVDLLRRLRGNSAIIQMIDSELDVKRKHLFVVMEQGETDLNHVLQQQALSSTAGGRADHRHLNMNFVRLTWHQMLSAVHCIHEARIVHGDLKPANFLFVKGALKLIDFGIAKAIQSEDTTSLYRDNQIGTLNYMSPEAIAADGGAPQRGGKPRIKVGRASDIWSLGCILYQMVYGQTPFADLHVIKKIHAIVDPNHVIVYPGGVDRDAIDAMQRCLRRKPDERAPIVGPGGLLSEHRFLHPQSSCPPSPPHAYS